MSKREVPSWLSGYRQAVQKQEKQHQKELVKKEHQEAEKKQRENEAVMWRQKVETGLRNEWDKLKLDELVDGVFRFVAISPEDYEATSAPYVAIPFIINLDRSKRAGKRLSGMLPEKESLILQGGIFYDWEGWDLDQDTGKSTSFGGKRPLFSVSLSENFFIIDEKEKWPLWEIGGPDNAKSVVGKYLARKV